MRDRVTKHVIQGAQVVSETSNHCVLRYPERPINHPLHAIVTYFTLGLWAVGWLWMVLNKRKEKILHLHYHPNGEIKEEYEEEYSTTKSSKTRVMVAITATMAVSLLTVLVVVGALIDDGTSLPETTTLTAQPEKIYSPSEIYQTYRNNKARAELLFEIGEVYVEGAIVGFNQDDLTAVYLTRRPGNSYRDLLADWDYRVFRAHFSKSKVAEMTTSTHLSLRCSSIEVDRFAGRGNELVCKDAQLVTFPASTSGS